MAAGLGFGRGAKKRRPQSRKRVTYFGRGSSAGSAHWRLRVYADATVQKYTAYITVGYFRPSD